MYPYRIYSILPITFFNFSCFLSKPTIFKCLVETCLVNCILLCLTAFNRLALKTTIHYKLSIVLNTDNISSNLLVI